jgi:hypothetical protein
MLVYCILAPLTFAVLKCEHRIFFYPAKCRNYIEMVYFINTACCLSLNINMDLLIGICLYGVQNC